MSGTMILSRGPLYQKYGHLHIAAQRQELTDRIRKIRETPPEPRQVESVIYAKEEPGPSPYAGIMSIMGVPTVRYITWAVAAHYGASVETLKSGSRSKETALRRQIGIWLSYRLSTKSTVEVGRMWGGRDHTTILHACAKISDILAAGRYSQVARDVESLVQTIGGEIALEQRFWGS